jgi:hypothetical protein
MLTRYLARLLGLWSLVAAGAMLVNRSGTIAVLNGFFADPALMWISGVFMLLVGLAIVLSHNRWSGGAVTAIVSLYGWIVLVKGLLFLCLPPAAQAEFYRALHFETYFYAYLVVALVLGAYLNYGGFKQKAPD